MIVDLLVVPDVSLGVLRVALSFAGISLLLFGLIWEAEEQQ
jgi:hypothetical protein